MMYVITSKNKIYTYVYKYAFHNFSCLNFFIELYKKYYLEFTLNILYVNLTLIGLRRVSIAINHVEK